MTVQPKVKFRSTELRQAQAMSCPLTLMSSPEAFNIILGSGAVKTILLAVASEISGLGSIQGFCSVEFVTLHFSALLVSVWSHSQTDFGE